MYTESTAGLLSKIGMRIMDREAIETSFDLRKGLILAVQRGTALSILTAFDKDTALSLKPAECLLNASRNGCKLSSLAFVSGRDQCSVSKLVL